VAGEEFFERRQDAHTAKLFKLNGNGNEVLTLAD
jgi:hypothetical protein